MKTKPLFISLTVGLALVLALWPPMARPIEAAIYTVSTVVDENDGSCSDGDCSLRDAIILANNNPGPDTITFNISGCGGVCTIQPHSELPFLLGGGTTIDGYTQPGAAEATDGTPATLQIEINGASAGDSNGFYITSAGNVIKGLVINRLFRRGIYIYGSGATGNTVSGNYIGTNISGTAAMGNGGSGVSIHEGAQYNTIGGDAPNERNVISSNDGDGVDINGSGYNTVSGNYIGTDISGTAALPNGEFSIGVCCGASNNTIGGDTPGERNVIVGSSGSGVAIFRDGTSNNVVIGNYIGTDSSGMAALPNSTGVWIAQGAQYNIIGGDMPGECNLISGNGGDGVLIAGSGTMSNTVSGNYVGTDASGTAALPNGNGISISDGASYNAIGGDTEAERNIISGNNDGGVRIDGSGSSGNIVRGNFIGTDITGARRIPNGASGKGVFVFDGATNNIVGGSSPNEGNLISGNDYAGIEINGTGTTGNVIQGNYIGTDVTGAVALGNWEKGVFIFNGAQYNRVGGTTAGERNVISGNDGNGVKIEGPDSDHNVVTGNYIGTDANGTTAIGNAHDGVAIWDGQYNVIGGNTPGERNVVSGNGGIGVSIGGSSAMSNTVSGNYIGTDVSGTADLGNTQEGVLIWNGAQNNTIGPDNVIAYNGWDGVAVDGGSTTGNAITQNSIFSNDMGIDLTGGANGDIAAPVIVIITAGSVNVVGTACAGCTVEMFENGDTDGEGETYVGDTTANANGVFTVTVSSLSNPYLTATATDAGSGTSEFSAVFTATVPSCTVLTGVTINGATSGVSGQSYTFTADVSPTEASTPITYNWSPEPASGQGTNQATYTWHTTDNQTISVNVSNCSGSGAANDNHTIAISSPCRVLTSVSISGATSGVSGQSYTFTADVSPSNAGTPITYQWSPAPASGQGTSQATYTWNTTGNKTISVNVSNCSGSGTANDNRTIAISFNDVYLPIVTKGYCSCGPDNYEPNDSFAQAYGPLTSGPTYQSYISCCDVASQKDYFYIDISTTNAINIDLTNIPAGTDYDLYLYNASQAEVARSWNNGNLPEHISYNPLITGRYYILVFSPYSHYSTSPYSLRVTYD